MMKVLAAAAGAATLLVMAAATPALAGPKPPPVPNACALTDVSPTAGQCAGYVLGNALSSSPADVTTQTTELALLGLAWNGTLVEPQLTLTDSTIDFNTLLNGTTYIGIHWGAGTGPQDTPGGVTGFYRLDLGPDVNLDTITAAFGSQSGARLYSTQAPVIPCRDCGPPPPPPGVPEPASWALLIVGFGGVGGMLRRRHARALA